MPCDILADSRYTVVQTGKLFRRLTTLLPKKTFSNSINTALLNYDTFVTPTVSRFLLRLQHVQSHAFTRIVIHTVCYIIDLCSHLRRHSISLKKKKRDSC